MLLDTFNQYQYADLLIRSMDLYANTKYAMILRYLSGFTDLRILNAGCGSGELSFQLAQAGHRVLGIDPGLEYVRVAEQNARMINSRNCSFAVSSIEDFQPTTPFDCVIATDVLEHIQDDRTAFEKLISFVKPSGLVIITVPAGQWLFGYHDEALGHFRRYSLTELRRLVSERCQVDHVRYFGFTLIPVCYMYSKLLRKPYPVAESGDSTQNPLRTAALRTLLYLDKLVPMPLGTSLIMKGTRR
jgi:SAM-dependent methyltransferase